MKDKDFIEIIFEIAFGDDAINKDYTKEEVVTKIQEYSDNALLYEEVNT